MRGSRPTSPRTLPATLAANPRLGDWLRIGTDGTVEVRSGKVELGQGVLTALAQIVAEELDVDVARVRMTAASTGTSPDEGPTVGSLSVQTSGAALRQVCAEARALYTAAAADRLGAREDDLTVHDGTFTAPDGSATCYRELADDALLDRTATGEAPPKSASAYQVVGTDVPRVDLADKLAGRPRFAHDLAPEGLLYGRIVRPPSRGATLTGLDTAPVLALPGVVTVVREGNLLGVVADREEVALRAADRIRDAAAWDERPTLPDEDDLPAYLTSAPVETTVPAERGETPSPAATCSTVSASYHRPYLAHASLGPSTATALARDDGRLEVWSHTQGVYALRQELARALDRPAESVVVHHAEGAGCYGHNGADDAACDAAVLALAVPGRPVQVVWSRSDELAWEPFGPAGVVRITAGLAGDGTVLSWQHEIWGGSHIGRPGRTSSAGFLAASHRAGAEEVDGAPEPPVERGGAAARNAVPGYDFPAFRVVNNRLVAPPLRTSSLRSLGAFLNVFAAESFLDELAAEAGRDAVEFRLAHLSDPRGRAVLQTAADRAAWSTWTPPSESAGHGIAYARYKGTGAYCAVVAEVEAVEEVRVRRLVIAADAGLVITPAGAENQLEGGAIQATSWTLKERVRFDRHTVTSDTWETYPILRFSEVPAVEVTLLPGNGNPSLGLGECAQGPTAAAIANAVHDALGVRVRSLPLTPERIVAAMPD
jgi:nicotinate dehydrogenase subunit B